MFEKTKGVDIAKLREAIKRDLEIIRGEASRLIELAHAAEGTARANLRSLDRAAQHGDLPGFFAADLDMQASRLACRCDHYQALVEVAYLAEGGEL